MQQKRATRQTAFLVLLISLVFLLSLPNGRAQSEKVSSPIPAAAQEKKGIPDGCRLIEGDILVRIRLFKIAATWETEFWPDGIVPYEFDGNVLPAFQPLMLAAMAEWERVANVDFVARNDESDYLHIQNSFENSSFVGRQGGEQIVNISDWNTRFIIVHELGHALGYWHEQSRPDRDNFVQINWQNIPDSLEHNFEKHEDAGAYGAYDFDSVMHYNQFSFSNTGQPSITVLPPNQAWQSLIGQRTHLSHMDSLTMSFLYAEVNWRFVDQANTESENGTFLEPFTRFHDGADDVPAGGVLWIQPGSYAAAGVYSKRMTLKAPLSSVILRN